MFKIKVTFNQKISESQREIYLILNDRFALNLVFSSEIEKIVFKKAYGRKVRKFEENPLSIENIAELINH